MIRSYGHLSRGRANAYASTADKPVYLNEIFSGQAWSLSRMTPWATKAIRVRRSSDDAEKDIGFVGHYLGAELDTAALLAFVGAGDGFVVDFFDQMNTGGTDYKFTQATTTKQAKIVASGAMLNMITPDGGDGYVATAVPMGTPYLHLYMKGRLPTSNTTRILLEQSTNYNNNAQSSAVYVDNNANNLHVSLRDTTGATDIDIVRASVPVGWPERLAILADRQGAFNANTAMYRSDIAMSVGGAGGTQSDASGNFSTYDLYLFGRAATSLFCDNQAGIHTLLLSNADTNAVRSTLYRYTGY